mgnify:FL=1
MKNNKGFTLVEVVVSFSLIMIVMVYLIKTIVVVSSEETDLVTEQQYSVYQSTLLEKIYSDISVAADMTVSSNGNTITITSKEWVPNNKTISFDNNSITYDNTIYELPDNCEFKSTKYSIVQQEKENYYIIKINIKVNDKDKIMKIIIQN